MIPGNGGTLLGHIARLQLDQIFNHDIPKATGFAARESKVLRDGWYKLEPVLQSTLLHGTGILAEIGRDLDAVPESVVNGILSKFTDITKEDLNSSLAKLQGVFTGVEAALDQDAATSVKNLDAYIKTQLSLGHVVDSILSIASQALAVILNPTSQIGIIATYAETAYQLIKKLFGGSSQTPVPAT